VPWLRPFGLSPRSTKLASGWIYVGFEADKVALGQVFIRVWPVHEMGNFTKRLQHGHYVHGVSQYLSLCSRIWTLMTGQRAPLKRCQFVQDHAEESRVQYGHSCCNKPWLLNLAQVNYMGPSEGLVLWYTLERQLTGLVVYDDRCKTFRYNDHRWQSWKQPVEAMWWHAIKPTATTQESLNPY
jgi:hypothetical protein